MTAPPILAAPSLDDAPGLRHGFFTRQGGVSGGIYGSLNCGFGSGDAVGDVEENRRRAAGVLGAAPDRLVTVYQVHGIDVVTVETPWQPGKLPRADGMVTRRPGIVLGILTADCAPVLLADSESGVVGACHAGWRGALDGVVEATIVAMIALGAERARIAAAIGPCIAQRSYQVGPEFRAAFTSIDQAHDGFFAADVSDRSRFDLEGFVRARLAAAGIGETSALGRDTCGDERSLFSYRRATLEGEPDYGRLLSAITLTERP
jgi:YfiH family protein